MNAKSSPLRAESDGLSREHLSYLRLLLILIGSIFLAEVVAMILIRKLPPLPYPNITVTLIDAVIMMVLIFPVLYFLSFRPLLIHIDKRYQAEKTVKAEQQRFNDILETLPAYLILLSPDYHVLFANRFFERWRAHGQHVTNSFGRNQPVKFAVHSIEDHDSADGMTFGWSYPQC
jgi:PAS domain-containing protein